MTTPISDRVGSDLPLGLSGFIASLVSFAFGRFAYGALLPAMRDGLDLSFAAAGLMQSANLAAYLAGTLVAGFTVRRAPAARLLFWAVLATAGWLAGVGASWSVVSAAATMAALGFCGGVAWIAMVRLVIERAAPARRGWLLGLSCAGSGLGLPLVAVLIEVLRWRAVDDHWRVVWWTMAAVTVLAAAVIARLIGRRRAERAAVPPGPPAVGGGGVWRDLTTRPVPQVLIVYLFFGLGCSVFLTFAMAALSRGAGEASSLVWAAFGVAGGVGALVVSRLLDRWGPGTVLFAGLVGCGVATAVPAISTTLPAMIPAAVLFGLPLIGVGVVVASLLSEVLPTAARASGALAVATLLFGAGQAVGPVAAGLIIDRTGSFAIPFGLAALVLLSAAAASASASVSGSVRSAEGR